MVLAGPRPPEPGTSSHVHAQVAPFMGHAPSSAPHQFTIFKESRSSNRKPPSGAAVGDEAAQKRPDQSHREVKDLKRRLKHMAAELQREKADRKAVEADLQDVLAALQDSIGSDGGEAVASADGGWDSTASVDIAALAGTPSAASLVCMLDA